MHRLPLGNGTDAAVWHHAVYYFIRHNQKLLLFDVIVRDADRLAAVHHKGMAYHEARTFRA